MLFRFGTMSDGNDSDSSDGFSDRKSQNRKKRIKKKASKSKTPQEKWVLGSENAVELFFRFVLVSAIKEDHKKAIYSVTFNPFLQPNTNPVFATVGGRQLTIYQCNIHGEPGGTTVLQVWFYQSLWGLIEYSDIPRSRRNRSILHISMGNIRG